MKTQVSNHTNSTIKVGGATIPKKGMVVVRSSLITEDEKKELTKSKLVIKQSGAKIAVVTKAKADAEAKAKEEAETDAEAKKEG